MLPHIGFMDMFKRKGPQWIGGYSHEAWQEFRAAVEAALAETGTSGQWMDDDKGIRLPEGNPLGSSVLGVQNLAQSCLQLPRSEWSEAARRFVAALLATHQESARLETALADFAEARPLLRSRICSNDMLVGNHVARPLTDDLSLALWLDLPHSVQSVNPELLETWPHGVDDLLALGLDNVRAELAGVEPETITEDDVSIEILESDSFFTSTCAACIPKEETLPHGLLVGMPTRHVLMLHRIREIGPALSTMNSLAGLVLEAFEQGPGSVSPFVHLLRDGRFTPVPASLEGNTLSITPPPELIEVFERMSEGSQGAS